MPTNYFVKDKHNTLFKTDIDKLMSDIGRTITIHERTTGVDCAWCNFSEITQSSDGTAADGYDWTTHPNYVNTGGLRCPQCGGKGKTDLVTTTNVSNVIIEDVSGEQIVRGKMFYFPEGTKRITGKLADVLSDSTDTESATKFETAAKIVIDNRDFRLKSLDRMGIKDLYLYVAIVEATDIIDSTST